ncbi:hypothetical protein AXF42_Ash017056 [Apostasia shenzhenica]|uniref:Glycosyl transferase family 51 domain-containing protein n=1 Tax=Apostasia shenzhenica TaxID=1088818 RepID=A0A2I0B7K4_9ASPA|nr:hypothetical protein AXF42_Ash017056 [Apostasia shenzhenica]
MSVLLHCQPVTITTRCPPLPSPKTAARSLLTRSNRRHSLVLPVRCTRLSPSPALAPAVWKNFSSSFIFANPVSLFAISAGFLCVRSFLRVLPPDFSDRWLQLVELSQGAEENIRELPRHLIQAVLASEDRRFFYHFGVDPYGLGRAVVYYPNGGGGSTITQQLVKNLFLTSERSISRKFVEGILSLVIERRFSKWEILYAYLSKMYWGHGNFGVEAAAQFYFRKHPSLVNIGESALLSGILPGPEALNPITNPKKGKASQARALRRMVAAGFLDLETALIIVSNPICLNCDNNMQAVEEQTCA